MEINIQIETVQKPEDVLNAFAASGTWKEQTTTSTASNEDNSGNQKVAEFDFVATGAGSSTASSPSRRRALFHRGRHSWRSIKRGATENETATLFGLPETGKAASRTHIVAKAILPKG